MSSIIRTDHLTMTYGVNTPLKRLQLMTLILKLWKVNS